MTPAQKCIIPPSPTPDRGNFCRIPAVKISKPVAFFCQEKPFISRNSLAPFTRRFSNRDSRIADSEGPLFLMALFRQRFSNRRFFFRIAIPLGIRFSPTELRFSPSTYREKKVEGDSESTCERSLSCTIF